MGYIFTMQSANIIGHLSTGNVLGCYNKIFESEENFHSFIHFIETFEDNMFSSRIQEYIRSLRLIKKVLYEKGNLILSQKKNGKLIYDNELISCLKYLSDFFYSCKTKALLLPGMNEKRESFMCSSSLLRKLVEMHPNDSCLILQPETINDSIYIFDIFPHFEEAFINIDKWPAILFWNNYNEYIFIPVKTEEEVKSLFKIVKGHNDPLMVLKKIYLPKESDGYYLLQLSDLHLGDPKVIDGESRIKTLIKKRIKNIGKDGIVDVVITGDAVESPTRKYEKLYKLFSEYIYIQNNEYPIRILGNHDIFNHGISFCRKLRLRHSKHLNMPPIKIIDKYKVVLMFFNSNTKGNFAQGEIGKRQMTKMGNLLDDIENVGDYTLIAVLHHHIMPIEKPDFYAEHLFGKIQEKTLKLNDADIFIEWLKKRNVKLVLHGHKHIPFYIENDNMRILSCGSSTGKVNLKNPQKTYISYNVIKIDNCSIVCTQYVEDILGSGENNLRTIYIKL